ncbi:ABC transporter substrate-binding protein [Tianweitania sediminis]|uniref:ABC transporter substrate-binding protein n=1 Tax=Tianweitania sediminis TaxID=1502156 RepID=A0A8J7QY60_9HYPH|nr:ABC transporter substrate-binding protein [Tianweitania sediminis]MBP0437342.1 ABC transporter substrate-binding protein [Tianweitania sediminis]
MQTRNLRTYLAAGAVSVAASFAGLNAAAADVVKIGVLAPLTGPSASDGADFIRGVELAVEEQNAKGGVAGHTFEIVTADVKDGSPDNVSNAAQRLINTDGIEVVLTGYASLSLFEVDLFADANLPYLSSGPAGPFAEIVAKDPDNYGCCWSLSPSYKGYETDVLPLVEKLIADGTFKAANKKIAMISSDNPYSKAISEGMKTSFTAAGWTVTVDEMVPFGPVNDWRASLAKVQQDPPALVVNTDYQPANSALFLKQFLDQPTQSLVFLQYAPSVPEFVDLTKEQSNGVLYNLIGGAIDSPNWPRGQEVNKKLTDKFGVKPGVYGSALYEEAMIYFQALEKVGDPTDHDAIGQAIGEVTFDAAPGPVAFDPATHLAVQDDDHIPVTFWQIWDGQRTLISPAKYATGEFKLPPWIKQ